MIDSADCLKRVSNSASLAHVHPVRFKLELQFLKTITIKRERARIMNKILKVKNLMKAKNNQKDYNYTLRKN